MKNSLFSLKVGLEFLSFFLLELLLRAFFGYDSELRLVLLVLSLLSLKRACFIDLISCIKRFLDRLVALLPGLPTKQSNHFLSQNFPILQMFSVLIFATTFPCFQIYSSLRSRPDFAILPNQVCNKVSQSWPFSYPKISNLMQVWSFWPNLIDSTRAKFNFNSIGGPDYNLRARAKFCEICELVPQLLKIAFWPQLVILILI